MPRPCGPGGALRQQNRLDGTANIRPYVYLENPGGEARLAGSLQLHIESERFQALHQATLHMREVLPIIEVRT